MKQISTVLLLVMVLAACSQQATPLTENSFLDSLATFAEKQILLGGGVADAQFGRSVAIDGNRMVVTCECHDRADVAYIFERTTTGVWPWKYVKTLAARKPQRTYSDHQATISGDTIVISSAETGTVYIFDRNQGGINNWGQVKQLNAFYYYDGFGVDVSLDKDTLVVGAFNTKVGTTDYQGAAYIFQRNRGGINTWGQVKQLTAPDGQAFDNFGQAVAIRGDTVVIGAYGDTVRGHRAQGSAYIFQRDNGGLHNWGQVQKLVVSDGLAADFFGSSVALDGNTMVVGAWFNYYNDGKGYAYIYQRGATTWTPVKKLTSSDSGYGDYFGYAVAIHKDTVVVGAIYDTIGKTLEQGSAYIFKRNQGGTNTWGQLKKLTASDGDRIDYYGSSVAVSGSTVVVAAPLNDIESNVDKGAVYIYE